MSLTAFAFIAITVIRSAAERSFESHQIPHSELPTMVGVSAGVRVSMHTHSAVRNANSNISDPMPSHKIPDSKSKEIFSGERIRNLYVESATHNGDSHISDAMVTHARTETSSADGTRLKECSGAGDIIGPVSKSAWEDWQKKVVETFQNGLHGALPSEDHVAPKPGEVVRVWKQKIFVTLVPKLEDSGTYFENVAQATSGSLPKKIKVQMWHPSKGKNDGVSIGFDADKRKFVYPGMDTAGLVNSEQPEGETVQIIAPSDFEFSGVTKPFQFIGLRGTEPGIISCDGSLEKTADNQVMEEVVKLWPKLAGKDIDDVRTNLQQFVATACAAKRDLPSDFLTGRMTWAVFFVARRPEEQLLVQAETVFQETCHYYYRIYGKKQSDDNFAKIESGDKRQGKVCSISKLHGDVFNIINSGIEAKNIKNEYSPWE